MRIQPVVIVPYGWLLVWPVIKIFAPIIALCAWSEIGLHRSLHANLISLAVATLGTLIAIYYLHRWGCFRALRRICMRRSAANVIPFPRHRRV